MRRILELYRLLGARGLGRFLLLRWLHQGAVASRDLFSFYSFLQEPSASVDGTEIGQLAPQRTLNWVVPYFEVGSGGHLNIFRMIWHLERAGYRCRIVIVGATRFPSGEVARDAIRKHFVPLEAEVGIGEAALLPAEFTVATSWETAYVVRRFRATQHKLYFIQDIEPYFYPRGSEYVFAEDTYRFGFVGITAGAWIAETVRRDYGMVAYPFSFSYDKDRYSPGTRRPGPRRVFFYARSVTPRRGFELGLLALGRVHDALPDVEFVLAGWDASEYHIPFTHLNAGVVALDELPDLYCQCDVALVLSFSNLSLLPLELMACGCPVVSNRGPNVEWLLKDGLNAVLADPTVPALAAALVGLLEDKALHREIVERGLAFARATDWAREAASVQGYLEGIRGGA